MNSNMEIANSNGFTLADTNTIQLALTQRAGIDPLEWVEKNSADFRNVITLNPELHKMYQDDPDGTIEIISNRLTQTLH